MPATARSERTFLALDGSRVTVAGPFPDIAGPGATSFSVFRMDNRVQEFGAGDVDFASLDAARLDIAFTERYTLNGVGNLRVGSTERVDKSSGALERVSVGAWEGRRFSIRTVVYNRGTTDLIGLFDQFEVRETSEGVAMAPKEPRRVTVDRSIAMGPSVTHRLNATGMIEIAERTADVEKALPATPGKRVAAGELFVDGPGGADTTLVVLAGTARARVYPDRGADEARVIDAVSALETHWERAS